MHQVMLLVSSCARMDDAAEAQKLALYTRFLREAIQKRGGVTVTINSCLPSEKDVKDMYELCLLDYVRFMAGWGFWGNEKYAIQRVTGLLKALGSGGGDGPLGRKMVSQEDYLDAIYSRYPLPDSVVA